MNGATLWAWVLARPRNEKFLLGAGALALLYFVLTSLVVAPLMKYRVAVDKQLAEEQAAVQALQARLAALKPEDMAALREARRAQVDTLRAQLRHNESELTRLRSGLVGAGQMTDVLTRLLTMHRGVSLESVESLGAEPLSADPPKSEQGAVASAAEFFRHTLRLKLRGEYLEIARYLRAVESLPWRIVWQELGFEAADYPQNSVTVELSAVSTDPVWLIMGGAS